MRQVEEVSNTCMVLNRDWPFLFWTWQALFQTIFSQPAYELEHFIPVPGLEKNRNPFPFPSRLPGTGMQNGFSQTCESTGFFCSIDWPKKCPSSFPVGAIVKFQRAFDASGSKLKVNILFALIWALVLLFFWTKRLKKTEKMAFSRLTDWASSRFSELENG